MTDQKIFCNTFPKAGTDLPSACFYFEEEEHRRGWGVLGGGGWREKGLRHEQERKNVELADTKTADSLPRELITPSPQQLTL